MKKKEYKKMNNPEDQAIYKYLDMRDVGEVGNASDNAWDTEKPRVVYAIVGTVQVVVEIDKKHFFIAMNHDKNNKKACKTIYKVFDENYFR